jgi:hypothetical protein
MTNLRLFFYSHNNLLGLGLACIGPLLLLGGVLGKGWYLVSAMAYGMGWAASAVFFTKAALVQKANLTLDDFQSFLETLLRENLRQLPDPAVVHLKSICESLEQALPRFKEIASTTGSAGKECLVFRQVILNYLPQTLANYLRLPTAYAARHKVGDTGKTAKTLLIEQLGILDAELQATAKSLFESDINKMLVNSKFLESKFGHATNFLD